jgi:hypothetical protein
MKYALALSLLAVVKFGTDGLGDASCIDTQPCFELVGTTNPTSSVIENWEKIKTESTAPKGKINVQPKR